MKKNLKIILFIFGGILFLLGILILITQSYIEKVDKTESSCSFTKTYMVSNLWTVDTKEEIPEMSYIIIKQFQDEDTTVAIIPSKLRDELQEGKYYEFTYTIKGTNSEIKTMKDINNYFASIDNYKNFEITVDAKETTKVGLEQIQNDICLLK